jgi:O-methyltransferase
MDNAFIAELFDDWRLAKPSRRVQAVNRLLERAGFWCRLKPEFPSGGMTNIEQRMNLFHLVSQVLAYGVPGALVDVGCHAGESSVLMQVVIDHFEPSRQLHVYDSFEGLPPTHEKDGDTRFGAGQLRTTLERLRANFDSRGLRIPVIHKGWFKDTLPEQLPAEICFANLDGDLYESILVSFEHVYPRLSRGAICLIDDYCDPRVINSWNGLPGVKRACDEFLADKPERVSVLYSGEFSSGYFRKI